MLRPVFLAAVLVVTSSLGACRDTDGTSSSSAGTFTEEDPSGGLGTDTSSGGIDADQVGDGKPNRNPTTTVGSPSTAGSETTASPASALTATTGATGATNPMSAPSSVDSDPAPNPTGPSQPQPPTQPPAPTPPLQLRVTVLQRFPHDASAFTQGLLLDGGELFESTGLVGSSSVRRVELATGTVHQQTAVAPPVFAEGLALVGGELIQLTWRNQTALVYGRADLQLRRQYDYEGEGWGLCFDGAVLVQSDGSSKLRLRNPQTFAEVGQLDVVDGTQPVVRLNELECVGGAVYANVWQTSRIARIDPTTGRVTAWIDASALVPAGAGPDDVLNGIAYDPATDTFLLTGKRWSDLYRVTFG